MGLHQGAPKFVAPKWQGFGSSDSAERETVVAASVLRRAERSKAEEVRHLCNEALTRITEVGKQDGTCGPLVQHFMAHRYAERIIQAADMHTSPRINTLAWDARGLRWQIEALEPLPSIEHALTLLRSEASLIGGADDE